MSQKQILTPYLIVDGAARAIAFYERAFDAKETMRIPGDGDRIGHAELEAFGASFMLADEHTEMGYRGPRATGSAVSLLVYVPDVDATFARAITAGAQETRAVKDQPYGDRSGTLTDPFGHVWTIATHKEDMSVEEIRRRFTTAG
jgi:PhnB protein